MIYSHKIKAEEERICFLYLHFFIRYRCSCNTSSQPRPEARKALECTFGNAALGTLFGSHCAQVIDLVSWLHYLWTVWSSFGLYYWELTQFLFQWRATEQRQLIPALLTVAPNVLFAMIQFVVATQTHKDHLGMKILHLIRSYISFSFSKY